MPPRVSSRSESRSTATAAAIASVAATPIRNDASAATADCRCDHPAVARRNQGFTTRPTRANAAIAASGRLATTQPPNPLPPRPSSQPATSPPKSHRSTKGAAIRESQMPAGSAPHATATSRQPGCRVRQPEGISCQRWAASRIAAGITKNPVINGIRPRSITGENTSPAMNPSTTLGRLAIISIVGLIRDFHRGCMNWLA